MQPTKPINLLMASIAMLVAGCSKPASAPSSMPAAAPEPATSVVPTAGATVAAAAESAGAEKLAWLEGHWCAHDGEQLVEETWMSPQGDEAIGMSRTVEGGRQVSYEFMRIAKIGGKDTLFAQPSGGPATPFARTDGGADWIRFENPKHDYPTRIEYRKTASGLHAEIGGPGANDKEEAIPYDYVPCGK